MTKVYEEHEGQRQFTHFRCDSPGCTARLERGPHVVSSGWEQCDLSRWRIENGFKIRDRDTWHYCPDHRANKKKGAVARARDEARRAIDEANAKMRELNRMVDAMEGGQGESI